jgi:hypothetical protein
VNVELPRKREASLSSRGSHCQRGIEEMRKDGPPVRAISRSIMSFSTLTNDVLVSNRLRRTDIIISTSPGGHVSPMAIASTIYTIMSRYAEGTLQDTAYI